MKIEKHFVVFFSPGTFMAEQTLKPIESWDVNKAIELSYSIKVRHNATPYAFQFVTRSRGDEDLDSKESARSNMYYLGGEVYTLKELKAENAREDGILIKNMEANNWDKIIKNTNSYKWAGILQDGDIVLAYDKNRIK